MYTVHVDSAQTAERERIRIEFLPLVPPKINPFTTIPEIIIIEIINKASENYTGWVGDVFIGDHAMGTRDVLSDLDSVNISNLMRDNGTDYVTTTAQYYEDIRTGVIDRDKMFLSSVNFDVIRLACVYVAGGLGAHMTDEELEQKLQAEYKDIYDFYMRMKEAYEQ